MTRGTRAAGLSLAAAACLWVGARCLAQVSGTGIPAPAPATEMPANTGGNSGSIGASPQYARADHTHASSVQKASLTTGADGTAVWTFGRAFPTTKYVVAEASGAANVVCSWQNKTTVSVTFVCKQSRALPQVLITLTSLTGFDIFANPAAGVQIDAFAGAVTQ